MPFLTLKMPPQFHSCHPNWGTRHGAHLIHPPGSAPRFWKDLRTWLKYVNVTNGSVSNLCHRLSWHLQRGVKRERVGGKMRRNFHLMNWSIYPAACRRGEPRHLGCLWNRSRRGAIQLSFEPSGWGGCRKARRPTLLEELGKKNK